VQVQPALGNVALIPVCDSSSDNYLVLMLGWDGYDRVDAPVIHIRLLDGKVLLEEDNTDALIAAQLIEAGIAKADLVLAFQHPSEREDAEYAVA
jgi:hypothetical protein